MLYLHGIGHFHPDNEIDNEFLESLDVGVDRAWILERVGIRTRRTVLSKEYIRQTRNRDPRCAAEASQFTNAQTGAQAARIAMDRSGIPGERIGWVVAGGCSPQWLIPAEACTIAAELDLCATAFDINSACSSFVAQMALLDGMQNALPDFVLVVNAENTTRAVSYEDRNNSVLWGDGSVAAIVSSRVPSGVTVETGSLASDPREWRKVTIRPGGIFAQDGATVQAFAIRTMVSLAAEMDAAEGPERSYFIGHQANLRALESVVRRLGIPENKHLYNVDLYGNCGAAGAPSVLSQQWDRFAAGDTVTIAVVGSGLTWGSLRVHFRL
jgi:3-oxoacyl-[acyl-carrier-protein] synthase-3